MSDACGMDIGHLSPVVSPAPQAKQHTVANLTGVPRKVKDIAADFHNLMMKWNVLNTQGMDIISRIANIKIEKVFNVEAIRDEVQVVKLPQELNPLCDLLSDTVEAMSKVNAKMQQKAKMAEDLESLQQFQKSQTASPVLFSSMTLHDVANTLKEIYESFDEELNFKRELWRQVAHADSRDTIMFYCCCWMHQPYIKLQCYDLLEALLHETGHVK